MKTLAALSLAAILPVAHAQNLFADAPVIPDAQNGNPYIYLGHATSASANLTLHSAIDNGSPVTTIPANAPLTLLLATPGKTHYLVKTDFGLTGWLAANAAPAPDASDSEDFSALKTLHYPEKAGDDTIRFTLHYQPERIQPVTPANSNEDVTLLLQGRFAASDTVYRLECSPGMSADPYCELLDDNDLKQRANGEYAMSKAFGGETFYLPGNGTIYGDTASNRMHRTRSKYRLDNSGKLEEIAQPYAYVGLNSRATRELPLRASSEEGSAIIARVASGDSIEVLLSDAFRPRSEDDLHDFDFILVKTGDGTLGWYTIDFMKDSPYDTGIDGYHLHGD